jgi:hypothetical protein
MSFAYIFSLYRLKATILSRVNRTNIPYQQWKYAIINQGQPGEVHKLVASHSVGGYQMIILPINPDIFIEDLKVFLNRKGFLFDDYTGDYHVENPTWYLFLFYFNPPLNSK